MRKLEVSDADVMTIAIRQEIERTEEPRYDHRLHGVLLVAKGMSARQAALWLDEGTRTVQRWVNGFEANGFAALREGERPGRPRRLAQAHWERLGRDLRKSRAISVLPRTCGMASCSRSTCARATESSSGYGSASASSGKWIFGCASHAR